LKAVIADGKMPAADRRTARDIRSAHVLFTKQERSAYAARYLFIIIYLLKIIFEHCSFLSLSFLESKRLRYHLKLLSHLLLMGVVASFYLTM
jgi:hypothetical protein